MRRFFRGVATSVFCQSNTYRAAKGETACLRKWNLFRTRLGSKSLRASRTSSQYALKTPTKLGQTRCVIHDLRAYNELLHRVTASVVNNIAGSKGFPLESVVKMVRSFGVQRSRVKEMEWVLERAFKRQDRQPRP